VIGKMGGAQDWREGGAAPQAATRVRGATGGASPEREEDKEGCTVAPEEPVLPLVARRSALAFPTASGVASPVWALTQEMARS